MPYVFDGYSEPSSGRNSPRNQQRSGGHHQRRRRRRRQQDGPVGGSGAEYFGTGRFWEENARQQQQQQQQRQQQPRRSSFGLFGNMDESGFWSGSTRSEAEWERAFMDAFRRVNEQRGQHGGVGDGFGSAGHGRDGARGGGFGQQGFRAEQAIRFEDVFESLFGGAAGGGIFGADTGGGFGGQGAGMGFASAFGLGSGGEWETGFEELFGPPGYDDGRSGGREHSSGERFRAQEDTRRGGAGMTWGEFLDLFRHRFVGGSPYGYAGGPPPADLFDIWHTDW